MEDSYKKNEIKLTKDDDEKQQQQYDSQVDF